MKKLVFYIGLIGLLFFTIEVGLRLYLYFAENIVNTSQANMTLAHYPSLKDKIKNYEYEEGKINILILGGSVVFEDTIPFFKEDSLYKINMCDFKSFAKAKYNILNLSFPGHTSLDSRYKLDLIHNKAFDYLFVYHGINDVRSNNTSKEGFDVNYRHMEFYDNLAIIQKHKEVSFILTPLFVERLVAKIQKMLGYKQYIPKEFLEFLFERNKEIEENYFTLPCYRFTSISFNRNLNFLLSYALESDITPILSTYGYYQPDNYSYQSYISGNLDYADRLFPTELYGSPECVPNGILKHNRVVGKLARKFGEEVIFIDLEQALPKEGSIFKDICHLTPLGCGIMYNKIEECFNE